MDDRDLLDALARALDMTSAGPQGVAVSGHVSHDVWDALVDRWVRIGGHGKA